jgi:hypothetical protein
MIVNRWKVAVGLVVLLAATLFGGTFATGLTNFASASTIFYDDFEDGSATDGSPVTWDTNLQRFPFTQFNVVDGNLRVSSSQVGLGVVGVRDLATLGDTSIRAQVRLESGRSDQAAALFVRGNEVDFRSYHMEIHPDGRVFYGISGSDLNVASNLRPTEEDVVLQRDAIGNSITGWAWRAGEPKPTTPMFSFVDDRLASGFPGGYFYPVSLVSGDSLGTAIYRYVHVADMPIPEPSGASFAASGVLAIALIFGRHRLWQTVKHRFARADART